MLSIDTRNSHASLSTLYRCRVDWFQELERVYNEISHGLDLCPMMYLCNPSDCQCIANMRRCYLM